MSYPSLVFTVAVVASVIGVLGGAMFVVVLIRISRQGSLERLAEDEAREHFSRHGRWPDEEEASQASPGRSQLR